ncbi:ribulose-phosphate 3-epimerase [Chryseolinea sp. H1M3-3]|uniref:ribulose-phosphate 3-epimerase n=1 Tax=Chryseolinea sp. H1M3-3 TaxID=3034144 RepID=UPI0023EB8443|nr:ribulose-phosphate 3-epimerase [Chryseolinea sp. H1M3-3]
MSNHLVAPSILAADFANLEREVKMINNSQADWIHVDVMDGTFVPNFSLGIPVVEAIKRHAKKPLDVHLMIVNPEHHVEAFRKAGADHISVHVEVCHHLQRNISQIKSLGCKAGVAINPHTPIFDLENVIAELDLVIVMSVNPGFGGQKFLEHTFQKVAQLKELITQNKSGAKIEVDGGVSLQNSRRLLDVGVDILVAGNFVFNSDNPTETIRQLKDL